MKNIEKIFKALGDKSRLRIINMLAVKPLCVCEVTEALGLSQSTVSGHLKVLNDAGLIKSRKEGLWVEYSCCCNEASIDKILDYVKSQLSGHKEFDEDKIRIKEIRREDICKK